ncbi:pentapeptide repeat-containing protein [Amycolatopsis sp. NPDC049253]|uniref:pentapeptide repeat-containing protein n=1 Tax=Amycolatopsis sp. NPDC049253 TaxID=3155274 RepID=UPI0034215660
MRSPLLWTFVASVLLLCGVGGWLLTDPATSRSDALKTGGLAGGAVVALYALWLNDRRRRVEEARQEIERQRHDLEMHRAEQDRERVSDERFAKSVELLGHEADQVRVGALHALAGLARSRPTYTQTVLDVLCAYLRRPFEHARYGGSPDADERDTERELQVRLTAQRLVAELLPWASEVDAPSYDLDLTGAVLEYLDLSRRKIGRLLLRYASLHSSTNLSGCLITDRAYFTAAGTGNGRLIGNFRCRGAKFLDYAWFSGTVFAENADFTETTFAGRTAFKDAVFTKDALFTDASFDDSLDLRRASFDGHADLRFARVPEHLSLYNTKVTSTKDNQIPTGWLLEPLDDGVARITVRAG